MADRKTIEHVARALFESDHGKPTCACHGFEKERREYERRARVAIAAMAELGEKTNG